MRIIRTLPIITAIVLATLNINAKNLLRIPDAEAATIGIYIEDLKTGEVIASQNVNKVMTPASVTKSITSAAAMLLLDENFQFQTPIYAVGDTTIYDGILNCNIVIKASGDPTIESTHFPKNKVFITQIINGLKSKGISKINGDIIINSSKLNFENVTSTWMLEDIAWDYGAILNDFNYKNNSFEICLPTALTEPLLSQGIPNLMLTNELIIGEENNISLTRSLDSNNLVISGTIKPTISNYKISCSMPEPSAVFIADFKSELHNHGIVISNNCLSKECDSLLIYSHKSPKRNEILRSLMVRSDNLFAEAMLQTINPNGGAIDSVISKFEQIGIDCSKISLYDGSGLSRVDRLSPLFLADVYRYMYNSDMISDYIALFPKTGCDGTLKNFLSSSRLKGQLALKTGSMDGVQCYGGYKLNKNGEPTHIVVIMVNNFFCKRKELRKDIERLLLQIF